MLPALSLSCRFLPLSLSCLLFLLFFFVFFPLNFVRPKGEILVSTTERDSAGTAPGEGGPARNSIPNPDPRKDGGCWWEKGDEIPRGSSQDLPGEIGFIPSWLFPQPGKKGDSGLSHLVPGFPNLWEAGIQNRSGLAQNGCRGMRFLDSFGNTWRGGLEVHYFPQIPSFFGI